MSECSECHNQFSKQSLLNIHMKTHAGERSYSCNNCENNFNQKQHLDQHNLLIHGISDDQNCEGCDTCKERQVLETMKAMIENKLNSLPPCTL